MNKLSVEVWRPLDYTINPGDRPDPVLTAYGIDHAREVAAVQSAEFPDALVAIRDAEKSPPIQAYYERGEDVTGREAGDGGSACS